LAEIEQIYRYAPIGLFAIDREYRFTRMNEFLAEINGFTVEEHIGKTLWDVLPNLADHLVEIYRPVFERGEPVLGKEIHGQTPKSPGVDRDWLASYFPFKSETGEVIGLIGAVLEVTERKRAEEALRRSEAYLAEAQRLSHTGSWAWNVATREFVHWSQEHYRVHGLDPQQGTPSWEAAQQFIHPDDRARCLEQIDRAVQGRKDCELEYRAVLQDGTVKYIHSVSHPVFNAAGDLVEFVGTEMDVTERRRAEEAVRKSEERLRQAVRASNLGIFEHDHLTETYYWSPEERAIHGWEAERAPNISEFVAMLHPEDRERIAAAIRRAHDPAGDGLFDVEQRIIRPDGEVRRLVTRSQTVFEGEGAARRPVRTVGAVIDITERKYAEESLRASLREKEVLLKEVHHRVKNNLQLISSLLALQAGQLKDRAAAAAFAESQNRVRAMALVHENLYRSGDLASVRLAGHLESLCAYLVRSYNVDPDRIVLDLRVAEVTLDLDRSIRLGLLVNELVSNVLKHAFPAGRSGRVLVQLDMPGTGWCILVVSDNGVGLPPDLAPGHSDSLGLQLIADLTEQLGGTLVLDRGGGTTFSIRFPVSCPEDSRS
jgi:PAS domain S-box-containing protein